MIPHLLHGAAAGGTHGRHGLPIIGTTILFRCRLLGSLSPPIPHPLHGGATRSAVGNRLIIVRIGCNILPGPRTSNLINFLHLLPT